MCMGRVERVIGRLPSAEPKNRCKNSNSNKYNPTPNDTKELELELELIQSQMAQKPMLLG